MAYFVQWFPVHHLQIVTCLKVSFNALQNDKILDWSKLKAIANLKKKKKKKM